MSLDVHIENRTPFDLALCAQIDAEGQEVLVLMLSASFTADAEGRTGLHDAPVPVTLGDVSWGDPARSSTRYESDIAPVKPGAEVVVNAVAHAPGGRPAASVRVGLQAGPVRKMLAVTGDRVAHLGALSEPHPFATLPIVWERAFGGSAEPDRVDLRNPLGIGHEGARSADPEVRSEAANVTYPEEPVRAASDRPRPAGFGAVGRGWQPRLALAGTNDAAWLASQWPLPAADFDPRHNLSAPPDQWLPALPPGLPVTLVNLTPEGRWEFRLPRLAAPLRLLHDGGRQEVELAPDTLLIEPSEKRFTLKARLAIPVRRKGPKLREVLYGHVSPVLLSARQKRKAYLNPTGGDGTLAGLPVFEP